MLREQLAMFGFELKNKKVRNMNELFCIVYLWNFKYRHIWVHGVSKAQHSICKYNAMFMFGSCMYVCMYVRTT